MGCVKLYQDIIICGVEPDLHTLRCCEAAWPTQSSSHAAKFRREARSTSPPADKISRVNAMHEAILRKVGGSVMLAVPPALLDVLQLQPGATVGITLDGGRLVVEPRVRPRYTLAELLAASDYTQPVDPEERAWLDAPAVGRELI